MIHTLPFSPCIPPKLILHGLSAKSNFLAVAWTISEPEDSLINLPHNTGLWKTIMSEISACHSILADAPDEILAN